MYSIVVTILLLIGSISPCSSRGFGAKRSASRNVTEGDANMTFFDDDMSVTGVKFTAYPLKWNEELVFPVAVHHDDFASFSYKILRISVRDTGRVFYGHVVDLCDRNDPSCKSNNSKNNLGFLLDVHKKGWTSAGADDGVLRCSYKVVGKIPLEDIPTSYQDATVLCGCKNEKCDLNAGAYWCPRGACSRLPNCW